MDKHKQWPNGKRGFAGMSPEKRREVASMGGKAVQALGRAHQWTPTTASLAGKKGGEARQRNWRKANGVAE